MNDGFSISFLSISLILLLIMLVTLMPPCSAGLPELPITNNPKNFGFENNHQYPILTIKADGNKFFANDWISDMDLVSFRTSIETSNYLLIRADARLRFGEVRRALAELSKYRTQDIILIAEQTYVAPEQISPFEQYLLKRLRYCGY